jgi:predicted N-acyltransferase
MKDFHLITSISAIPETQWQKLQRNSAGDYPFLGYRFLAALEHSGCIGSGSSGNNNEDNNNEDHEHDSGWQVQYLVRFDSQGEAEIIIPCYRKTHSYGEYVFDWSWAEAYQRYALEYYPKLLWAAPFTPASGPRLLHNATSDIQVQQAWQDALQAVQAFCSAQQLSGWHLNFVAPGDKVLLDTLCKSATTQAMPPVRRRGCQFHWFNQGYISFDHYLQSFASRKRKNVRKERQRLQDMSINIVQKTADNISAADIHFFYQCYQLTYWRRRSQGYLNETFFQLCRQHLSRQMLLVQAEKDGQLLASALYFFDDTTLYGRYWGCQQDIDGLHFEACYYQGIEFCIKNNLQRCDPGTQGEHKISRGFTPGSTFSYHQLMQPEFQQAGAHFAQEEEAQVIIYEQQARSLLPFKR